MQGLAYQKLVAKPLHIVIVKPIKNEQEYKSALEAIEQLLESEPGTSQGAEFEVLARLIEEYEDIHYPLKE